ncbi:hypothetical protein C8Q70DRAFT_938100 [Cubamyces menziesii]|nr:hypothetical protein C8Q70DRAFT_938100 [Cubamyces menziesii]
MSWRWSKGDGVGLCALTQWLFGCGSDGIWWDKHIGMFGCPMGHPYKFNVWPSLSSAYAVAAKHIEQYPFENVNSTSTFSKTSWEAPVFRHTPTSTLTRCKTHKRNITVTVPAVNYKPLPVSSTSTSQGRTRVPTAPPLTARKQSRESASTGCRQTSPLTSSLKCSLPDRKMTKPSTFLIHEDTARKLWLRLQTLLAAIPLGNTFESGGIEAMEWVKLHVSVPDGSWSSRAVHALVVSSLCSPVILCTPFFEQNHVLVDIMDKALWHVDTGRDLTIPFARSSPPAQTSATEEQIMHNRLQLSQYHDLLHIPHLDDLPDDIYHEINLKDTNLAIIRRQYECPKKYREAWKMLLQ